MKKTRNTLLIAIAALAMASGAVAQSAAVKKTDWDRDGLKGKVKSVRTIMYRTSIDAQMERLTRDDDAFENNSLVLYDTRGNRLIYYKYKADGTLLGKNTYRYDNKDNRVEIRGHDEKGNLSWKETYLHDNRGYLVEEKDYSLDTLSCRYTYKYDDKGNIMEEREYAPDGTLRQKSVYTYEDGNKRVKRVFRSGKVVSESTRVGDDDRTVRGMPDGKPGKYGARDDDLEGWMENPDGSRKSRRSYEYKYDREGNWVTRAEFWNSLDVVHYITERTIVYHD